MLHQSTTQKIVRYSRTIHRRRSIQASKVISAQKAVRIPRLRAIRVPATNDGSAYRLTNNSGGRVEKRGTGRANRQCPMPIEGRYLCGNLQRDSSTVQLRSLWVRSENHASKAMFPRS